VVTFVAVLLPVAVVSTLPVTVVAAVAGVPIAIVIVPIGVLALPVFIVVVVSSPSWSFSATTIAPGFLLL
jgi:hypothetical protein